MSERNPTQPLRRRSKLTISAVVIVGWVWAHAQVHPWGYSFQSYEGDGSAARIWDAKDRLGSILPIGSPIAKYKRFFHDQGGACGDVVDAKRFPHTMVCSYSHGFLIVSEWKYVVLYDPSTLNSTQADLNFGLTGL